MGSACSSSCDAYVSPAERVRKEVQYKFNVCWKDDMRYRRFIVQTPLKPRKLIMSPPTFYNQQQRHVFAELQWVREHFGRHAFQINMNHSKKSQKKNNLSRKQQQALHYMLFLLIYHFESSLFIEHQKRQACSDPKSLRSSSSSSGHYDFTKLYEKISYDQITITYDAVRGRVTLNEMKLVDIYGSTLEALFSKLSCYMESFGFLLYIEKTYGICIMLP